MVSGASGILWLQLSFFFSLLLLLLLDHESDHPPAVFSTLSCHGPFFPSSSPPSFRTLLRMDRSMIFDKGRPTDSSLVNVGSSFFLDSSL